MSVLTGPATYDILSSELASCRRAAAVLGELAAQWQQIMVSLQRVEQEAASSQSPANAVENMNRTRAEAAGDRPRLKDGERLYPKSSSGKTPLGGLARKVTAWLELCRSEARAREADPAHHERDVQGRFRRGQTAVTRAP